MTRSTVVLLTMLAVGCANSPTAPSSPGVAGATGALDSHQGQSHLGQKLSLFFYSDDIVNRGSEHIVGLPVTVAAAGVPAIMLYTDRQGRVTFTLPDTTGSMLVSSAAYAGFCASSTSFELPLHQRVGFIGLHSHGC